MIFSSPPYKPNTAYIGNVPKYLRDDHVRELLSCCGNILGWNRAVGGDNAPRAFGFGSFAQPEGLLRAMRVLDGLNVGDSSLLVKVDDKTQKSLEEYMQAQLGEATLVSLTEPPSDVARNEDERTRQRLQAVIDRLSRVIGFTVSNHGLSEEAKDLITTVNAAPGAATNTDENAARRMIDEQLRLFRESAAAKEERDKERERDREKERERATPRDRVARANADSAGDDYGAKEEEKVYIYICIYICMCLFGGE